MAKYMFGMQTVSVKLYNQTMILKKMFIVVTTVNVRAFQIG